MLPATKFIGPATSCSMPKPRRHVGEGDVLAERHEMDLVDRIDDLAAVVDRDDGIVVERLPSRSPPRAPRPATSIWPGCSISPIAASASGRSVKKKGTAVSGHRINCGAGLPASAGRR